MRTFFFAHANGFPSPSYAPFFQALESYGHTVDYIERIGHNPKFPVSNNWPHLVQELEQEIRNRHQAPVIGIGHSAGGLLSYLLAHKRPTIYSHLILLDPPIINGWQNSLWWLSKRLKFSDRFTPAGASKNRRTQFESRQHAYDNLRQKRLFKDFTEASFEAYIAHGLKENEDGSVRLAFDLETELALFRTASDDMWRYRTPLNIPGLYLTGKDSEFAHMPYAERLCKQMKMEYQVLEGGHLFPQERPKQTAETIAIWLASAT